MESFDSTWDLIDKGGTIALFLFIVVAIWKRIFVPGWVYDWCQERSDNLERIATERAERLEKRIEEYERRGTGRDTHERP